MEVLDLDRSRIDVAVRFCPMAKGLGQPLFQESMVPVCALQLVKGGTHPLKTAKDRQHHTLLAVDTPQGMALTADWTPWFEIMDLSDLYMKSTMRFTQYADAIAAAIAGQSVAIARMPLLKSCCAMGVWSRRSRTWQHPGVATSSWRLRVRRTTPTRKTL